MTQESSKNTGGEILRLLRISYDLSISDLSEKTGISKSYITEIEKGIKTPSEKIIERYCSGLNIPENTLNYLLKNYPKKNSTYQTLLIEILKRIAKL